MQITGKRIVLKDYTPEDFGRFYALVSDPELRRLSMLVTPATEEEARRQFGEILAQAQAADRKHFFFGVFLKETDEYIGEAGFMVIKEAETGGIAEIGYFLAPAHRGQGYAAETARLLIDYCFTHGSFHKVIANCDARNRASEAVMIRAGMTKEGEFKNQRFKNGEWSDELRYAILKEKA